MRRTHRAPRAPMHCWTLAAALALALGAAPRITTATQPLNPIVLPLYSFDLASPTVIDGHVKADDVLVLNVPFPLPLIAGAAFGLGAAGDELDGLSSANALVGANTSFVLLFSVDRDSPGAALPDPGLVALGYPYNVTDQAARGHQAGDEYMSTQLYTRSGGAQAGSGPSNNSMVANNYDEGGTDFGGRPPTSAHSMAAGQPQDNVDALADTTAATGFFFSAGAGSPSLATLPDGSPSGAHLYRYDLITTTRYASFSQLGLQQNDDVDAMVVFDTNLNGSFDGSDQVLFSLAPGSPSLLTIAGASAVGAAADVFKVSPGQAPSVFAPAASLGLGDELDNIDALDILLCPDALQCVIDHSIRLVHGDFDGNGTIDGLDYPAFVACYGGEDVSTPAGCEPADADGDADADCADYGAFVSAWTADPPVPSFQQCVHVIPTMSEVGVALSALLLLIAGSWVIARRRVPQDGIIASPR